MTTEIQKQNVSALTFGRQPDQFLIQLGCFMETIQDAYRSKLSTAEQLLWRNSLCQSPEQFSMEEIGATLKDLIENPPLQRIETSEGWSTQPFTGIPTLPAFINRMVSLRDAAQSKAVFGNVECAPDPACQRCGGTGWRQTVGSRVAKCHCWAPRPKLEQKAALMPAEEDRLTLRDVLAKAAPGATVEQAAKPIPKEPVSDVLMSPELQEKRRKQMLKEFQEKTKA